MKRLVAQIQAFLEELRRRQVIRVIVVYCGAGFVALEAVDLLSQALGLPGWTLSLAAVLLIAGFPLAIGLAWVYNLTEEGVVRDLGEEAALEDAPSGAPHTSNGLIVGLLIVAIGLLLYPRVFPSEKNKSGRASPAAPASDTTETGQKASSSTAETKPRIAVLPFASIARDTTGDFFAQGMHEEVLNQLSKVSGLEVISRTSVLQYAQTQKTVKEISRELGGISALVEGTVRRAAGRVRITTQLIKAPEDEHLWSKTYQRKLSVKQIFEIQASIARKIASALETELTEGERKGIESAPTSDLAAYDAYLQGRNQWWQFWGTTNSAHLDTVVTKLREAVRRDSTFAEAYAWLGLAYLYRAYTRNLGKADHWIDSAKVAIKRARSLNPNLAQAYVTRSFLLARRDSTSARVDALRRALELQPSHAFAMSELSDALRAQGRYVEAVRVAHEAIQLDPRNPAVHQEMADQLRNVGLYDAAEAWERRALEIEPGHAQALRGLMGTQLMRGEPGQAMQTWQRLLTHQVGPHHGPWLNLAVEAALQGPGPARAKALLDQAVPALPDASLEELRQTDLSEHRRALLGLTELRLGNRERGRQLLQQAADSARARLGNDPSNDFFLRFLLAETKAALDETDRALKHLEHWRRASFDDWAWYLKRMRTSPFLGDLRSEPRFQQILRAFESKQKDVRAQVRLLNLDLYPPGVGPNSTNRQTSTDG